MILSILIPTLPERVVYLTTLIKDINHQIIIRGVQDQIEIITDDRKEVTTGEKRNFLLKKSIGDYTWFIDDDDEIYPYSIAEVFNACKKGSDVIGINGMMTTDGKDPIDFEIRLGHPYEKSLRNGKTIYLRFPNHITPMRREYAIKELFPHKNTFEDFEWADKIRKSGHLKTQTIIDKHIYHYKFRTNKNVLST